SFLWIGAAPRCLSLHIGCLRYKKNFAHEEIEATHVITTSDERDPEWWSDVGALGWTWV
ncbi:hypothetical protein C8R48DRAFT_727015, partial [Suillus tomentosus]